MIFYKQIFTMNKFYFKEDNSFLNSHQKNFLENTVMSDNFPFYFYKESVKGDNNIFFSHMVKKRPEIGGEWNSTYKDNFIDILNTFCKKNNIKYNEILRCTINLTIKKTDKKHFDLEWIIIPQSNILFKWKILLHEMIGYLSYVLAGYI